MKKLLILCLIASPLLSNSQIKTCWDLVDSLKKENRDLKLLLQKNGISVPISDTIYTVETFKATKSPTIAPVKANTSSATQTSHQCHGKTKKGTRCSRMVANGYNCWQHGG